MQRLLSINGIDGEWSQFKIVNIEKSPGLCRFYSMAMTKKLNKKCIDVNETVFLNIKNLFRSGSKYVL